MGLVRRQSAYKLLVNVGVTAAEGAAACLVFFTFIGDTSPGRARGLGGHLRAATLGGYLGLHRSS